jgi:hypothetical protein
LIYETGSDVCHARLRQRWLSSISLGALCKEPDAAQQFRRLLSEASIEGQMYALLGLRQLHAADYKAQVDRYRKSTRQVNTGSGCEIGPKKVSYVVNEWVDKMPLE